MATGGGTSVISLPKGGDALQGSGETFCPDLHTGTGNFTVPIAFPPGRNGFQPQLSLVYSTGNGPFGLGCEASASPASAARLRKASLVTTMVFVLSGAEDLVAVGGERPGPVLYRPRTEGLLARITHRRDPANNYWEVRTKDGLRRASMGCPASLALGIPLSLIPPRTEPVFAWKLARTEDP